MQEPLMPLPIDSTAYPLNSDYHKALRVQHARWWVPQNERPLYGRDANGRPGKGEPITAHPKMRVPIVADLATVSADLLFGEPAEVLSDDDATTSRLKELFATVETTLLEGAEHAAAMSGSWFRVAFDRNVSDQPLVQSISPLQVDARWQWGRVVEATVFHEVEGRKNDGRYVHVEHHEPGKVTHQLRRAPTGSHWIGPSFPLTMSTTTADLAPEMTLPDGVMSIAYLKNMGPSPYGDWGRADTQLLGHFLDALDTAWSSWIRDVRLGKARIIMPNEYLRRRGRGRGATFDEDQEVYVGLEEVGPKEMAKPELFQPDIRTEAHAKVVSNLLEAITRSAGYSPESVSLQGQGIVETASALRIHQHRTMRTRARKQRYATPALIGIARAMLAIDAAEFGRKVNPDATLRVEFGDTAAAGPLELAQTAQMLDAARAASTETRVRIVHPKWEDQQVNAEVALIQNEEKENPRGRTGRSTDPPVPTPTPNPGPPSPDPDRLG